MAKIHDHPNPLIAQGDEIELPVCRPAEDWATHEETLSFGLGPGAHRRAHKKCGEEKR
jgi:hypothetical protein